MEPESKNITCSKCGGAGSIGIQRETINYEPPNQNKMNTQYEISLEFIYMCPKCRGKGKVDWVSNIVGSKELVITSTQGVSKWTKLY